MMANVEEEIRTFCAEAVRQMHGLETRLRTMVAGTEQRSDVRLLGEAVSSSLQIARVILDAGQRGQHATLLALRPLLRALPGIRA